MLADRPPASSPSRLGKGRTLDPPRSRRSRSPHALRQAAHDPERRPGSARGRSPTQAIRARSASPRKANGTTSHLTASLFQTRTGIKLTHVPYGGPRPRSTTSPAATSTSCSWTSDRCFRCIGGQGQDYRGRLSGTRARPPGHPDCGAESIPNFRSTTWYAFATTPKTPVAVGRRDQQGGDRHPGDAGGSRRSIARSMSKAAKPTSAKGCSEFIKSETRLWSDVIRAANITLD